MHEIKKYQSKIFLCARDGTREVFSSVSEIKKKYGWRFLSEIGAGFNLSGFQLKDEFGDVVLATPQKELKRRRLVTFVEKGVPVPRTGKSGHYSFFRAIKVYGEVKLNARCIHEDGEPECRPSRRSTKLSGAMWDDRVRHVERSWKKHRGHQWRAKRS